MGGNGIVLHPPEQLESPSCGREGEKMSSWLSSPAVPGIVGFSLWNGEVSMGKEQLG